MMMIRRNWVSALAVLGLFSSAACGGDKEKESDGQADSGTPPDESDGGDEEEVPPFRRAWGTLVQVTAQDTAAPIKIPHKVVILDAFTDKPIGDKFQTMTSPVDGSWEIKDVPTNLTTSIHVIGQGTGDDGTYDSMLTNIVGTTADDALTRISTVGTANVAGIVSGFTADQSKGAMTVGVYHVRNRQRIGVVGCVQVWLDDDPSQPPKEGDLRYVNAGGLPTPIAQQDRTEKTRGALLFANLSKGKHKMKFSVDGGKNFFGETEFYIGKSRDDASSPFKAILYQIGIELKQDMTPPGCQ